MATPNIYKSIKGTDSKAIVVTPLNSVKKAKVNTTISNFIDYVKRAHS